jgi:sulfur-carrier protein
MQININLFASLRKDRFDSTQREFPEGTTIQGVLSVLAISSNDAAIIFVNGRHAELDTVLRNGDTVSLFPPIGGG